MPSVAIYIIAEPPARMRHATLCFWFRLRRNRRALPRSPSVANQFTTAAFIARDFVLMKSSTKDKIKGGFEEAKGKVKEKAGKATGNPDLRDRGTAEKAGGKIQRKIGDVKKVFEQ